MKHAADTVLRSMRLPGQLLVTRGERGAALFSLHSLEDAVEELACGAEPLQNPLRSVSGAGDSLCAGSIAAMLSDADDSTSSAPNGGKPWLSLRSVQAGMEAARLSCESELAVSPQLGRA